jgi:hypothetical protein
MVRFRDEGARMRRAIVVERRLDELGQELAADWAQTAGGIEVATAATALEFVDALRPSNPHWWDGASCPWVFRGDAYEEWQLLPSAWRSTDIIMKK